MSRRPTVSSDLLRLALRYARSVGLNATAALAGCGLDPGHMDPDGRVGAAEYGTFLDALARESGDACFGLHLGASTPAFAGGHLVLAIVANSPTLGGGLERLLRYHRLLSDAVEPSLSRAGKTTSLRLAPAPGVRLGRDSVDAVVAMLVRIIRGLAPAAAVVGVGLRRDRPPAVSEHERVLGVPVRFEALADTVDLATAALDGPLVGSPEVLAALEPVAARHLAVMDGPAFAGRVRVALRRALLDDGELPSLDRLARSLGVGARTLQVRLREEGSGFRVVAEAVRHELAEELLRAPEPSLSEIAFTLGFGDQSAFTNAFRRWAGTTPGHFRAGRPAPPRAASPRSRGSAGAGARSARRRPGPARR